MFKPRLKTPPTELPVTINDMKGHLRIDYNEDDDVLLGLLSAASSHFDGYNGNLERCLVTQTWAQDFTNWGVSLPLPFPDVQSVIVTYSDENNVEQTVSESDYELLETTCGFKVSFKPSFTAPTLADDTAKAVTVEFVAGYGSPSSVPEPIKVAIKLLAAHWFENREAVGAGAKFPFGVDALTAPYRLKSV